MHIGHTGKDTLTGIKLRQYRGPDDFELVGDFLIEHFQLGNRDGNWLQPTWEYMHGHPLLDPYTLDKIGIWEEHSEIVGVAHHESRLGEVFFEIHPGYMHLKATMLEFAEEHLWGTSEEGDRYLRAFINDFDSEFTALVKQRGYVLAEQYARPLYQFEIATPFATPFPKIEVPKGFRIRSLADNNDLRKVHRVLWRGFNHAGEPPEDGIGDRQKMQSTPNFKKELTIVIEAPTEDFVSYCGMWYEPVNEIALVEPVATDPDYRRIGLGRAAVLEGIRRCGELGAKVAFVGSNLEFYQSMGFKKGFVANCWEKRF